MTILALDQGTTSSRAIAFDPEGRVLAVAQREFEQHFPQPGWVEHDPEEIARSQFEVAREVVASVRPKTIRAIGITNQRETTVVWERATGTPIAPAIVWQDRRTAAHCDRLRAAGLEPLFRERTGLLLDPYSSGTKLAWILDNVEGARARAERGELAFGTVDTWLMSRLTGGALHITDVSNASRTLLYNIHAEQWDDELLQHLDIPRSLLPEVRSSSEVYGEVSTLDELAGVPIAGIVGDQQAATMGQLCLRPGLAKNTYGTGCFLLMNTGDRAASTDNKLLSTIAWRRDGTTQYALEGGVFIGGAIVQWLRDGLGIIESSSDVEALAKTVDDSGGVVLVPALAGLGAPHWDPHARGILIGMTRGTTRAHIARAALEGIAHQVADLAIAVQESSGVRMSELRVDGGAAANDLLLQIQADLLGIPVVRPEMLETTALGAAFMAGLAVGEWQSVDELEGLIAIERRFEPSENPARVAERRDSWRRAVKRCRDWDRD